MQFYRNRFRVFSFLLLFCVLLFMLSGCSPEAKKEKHMKKGDQYLSENKIQEAILEYKNVVQIDPKDAKAHHKLGQAYLKAGLVREGFSELSKTVELDPGIMDAHIQLGNLYLLSGNKQKAKEHAEVVLSKEANNSSVHLLLSNIHIAERNFDEAIKEANKAAEGDKKLEAYLHLAKLYIIKKDLPKAEEMFNAAVKVDEKNLRARFSLAEFYLRTGKRDQAE